MWRTYRTTTNYIVNVQTINTQRRTNSNAMKRFARVVRSSSSTTTAFHSANEIDTLAASNSCCSIKWLSGNRSRMIEQKTKWKGKLWYDCVRKFSYLYISVNKHWWSFNRIRRHFPTTFDYCIVIDCTKCCLTNCRYSLIVVSLLLLNERRWWWWCGNDGWWCTDGYWRTTRWRRWWLWCFTRKRNRI